MGRKKPEGQAGQAAGPNGAALAAGLPVCYESADGSLRLLKGDCIEMLNRHFPEECFDMIFADPPYFLSNGGVTCQAGTWGSVNKGGWDEARGVEESLAFNLQWLEACRRVLKADGTLWVSGTTHIIYSVGFALQRLGFRILNDIVWYKPNAPPNLSCRYFTHSTETVLWAARSEASRHYFDYKSMKEKNRGRQMRNLWEIPPPRTREKTFGKHPTQKPLELLERIILASTAQGALVLDPFCGSSTTGVAACRLGRRYVGIEMDEAYLELSRKRLKEAAAARP
jgi:site-specific DNA-methyltransferase (adenine-specific)